MLAVNDGRHLCRHEELPQLRGLGPSLFCLLGEEVVTEGFDDTRVRLPEPLHDLPVPELGFLLVDEPLELLALRVKSGLGDLRSNGQQLGSPFFVLKVFGDFIVVELAGVSRASELKQGRSRVHDEGAAGVGNRRHDLCLGILPVARIARELLSVDDHGSHRTLLAARVEACAPEGWMCQRSGRVP